MEVKEEKNSEMDQRNGGKIQIKRVSVEHAFPETTPVLCTCPQTLPGNRKPPRTELFEVGDRHLPDDSAVVARAH